MSILLNDSQREAIVNANAHLANTGLPTYSDVNLVMLRVHIGLLAFTKSNAANSLPIKQLLMLQEMSGELTDILTATRSI